MQGFKTVRPEDITDNVFKMIGSDWMLVTAGDPAAFNTMTASWGFFGVMWEKKVACCVIRPSRHTWKFMEASPLFSLSFFDGSHRKALNFCGTRSGRDTDKVKETGLSVFTGPAGSVCFEQARLVIECRKIYFQDFDPSKFLDPEIAGNYPEKDYHRFYLGEILTCMKKEGVGG